MEIVNSPVRPRRAAAITVLGLVASMSLISGIWRFNDHASTLQSTVSELESRVDELEHKVSTQEDEIEELKSDIEELKSRR